MMTLTRDGITLWVAAFAALVAYLLSANAPPTQWDYHQWLQFCAAAAGWAIGKLQVSGLPSQAEVAAGQLGSVSPDYKRNI